MSPRKLGLARLVRYGMTILFLFLFSLSLFSSLSLFLSMYACNIINAQIMKNNRKKEEDMTCTVLLAVCVARK